MEAYEWLSQISYRMAGEQAPVEQNDPTADMGTGQRVLAGIGQGMTNVGRHAANLVGLQSDEQLADAKQLDAPLLATGAGRAGSLIGETAATAPLMMGGAGVVGRVGMGAKALSNPIARGVVEGAAQGALMADPGEKLAGATMGGAFGGLVPAAGSWTGQGRARHQAHARGRAAARAGRRSDPRPDEPRRDPEPDGGVLAVRAARGPGDPRRARERPELVPACGESDRGGAGCENRSGTGRRDARGGLQVLRAALRSGEGLPALPRRDASGRRRHPARELRQAAGAARACGTRPQRARRRRHAAVGGSVARQSDHAAPRQGSGADLERRSAQPALEHPRRGAKGRQPGRRCGRRSAQERRAGAHRHARVAAPPGRIAGAQDRGQPLRHLQDAGGRRGALEGHAREGSRPRSSPRPWRAPIAGWGRVRMRAAVVDRCAN